MDSLSKRGAERATHGDMLDLFKAILGNLYDPDTNPNGIVNIGTAENYVMLQDVADFISEKKIDLSSEDFSYGKGPWGSPRLRKAMAEHMNRHFHPLKAVGPDRLLFANGVTSLCEMLGFSIGDVGDAILLSRPIYQAFQGDFGTKALIGSEFVDFGTIDQFSPKAVERYEAALENAKEKGTHIKALIVCHPHNPLGRCYPPETLIAFMKLCNKYKVHLLVDEIYALSVYDVPDPKAVKFQSILTLDTDLYIDPNYIHLLYGMSKDMAAGGIRLGCLYTRNEYLFKAMSTISMFHWSGSANEKVAITMLEDKEWMDGFLERSRNRLAERNKKVRKLLDDENIKYYLGANAGLFLWIDLRPWLHRSLEEADKDPWAAEDALTKRLFANKVFITNGKALSAEEPGWYRLIFAQEERTVEEGIRRIVQTIKK